MRQAGKLLGLMNPALGWHLGKPKILSIPDDIYQLLTIPEVGDLNLLQQLLVCAKQKSDVISSHLPNRCFIIKNIWKVYFAIVIQGPTGEQFFLKWIFFNHCNNSISSQGPVKLIWKTSHFFHPSTHRPIVGSTVLSDPECSGATLLLTSYPQSLPPSVPHNLHISVSNHVKSWSRCKAAEKRTLSALLGLIGKTLRCERVQGWTTNKTICTLSAYVEPWFCFPSNEKVAPGLLPMTNQRPGIRLSLWLQKQGKL